VHCLVFVRIYKRQAPRASPQRPGHTAETERINSVLFGKQNRTLGPCLALS
jgi:hypothetical protein